MRKLTLLAFPLLLLHACNMFQEKQVLVLYDVETTQAEAVRQQVGQIMASGQAHNIHVDTTSNLGRLVEDSIKSYEALVFVGVSGDKIDYRKQADLERYVQAGGGLVGIGTDLSTRYQWPWQEKLKTKESQPEANAGMAQTKPEVPTAKTMLTGNHSYDGGRLYFLPAEKVNDQELSHALEYVVGSEPNYKRAKSPRVPEDNRFVRIVLDDQLNEPMELDVLPDGRVMYIEREGKVKLYSPLEQRTKLLARFSVNTQGNYEDGLLGMALDPNFRKNGYVYFYYSPLGGKPIQRLSRFLMQNDSLLMGSEKVVLEVPVQRETCCHSGGGVEFGPDGLLYLSTGDNTSSKESNGYSPLDERPGRGPFDAQKSSGNTNDLRGKILRIKVEEDGSYSIPDGNMFPKDGSKGKPEIYVMGTRNPFRYSIDPKTNALYWGDVGPDSGVDSEQGPQSYDEWNRATEPGYYGWPYFVADNKAYPDWDFVTNKPGPYFDPEKPINDSPNNTGMRELPPAKKPLIWYPYGESEQWPILGKGSRSAMAGPVYYSDLYKNTKVKFPSYYDGKLFIYEWARNWIMTVSFDEEGNVAKIEPFMPEMELSKPIDMMFGPDGAMYILEYGANYFADNDEARLVKIEYMEGNRAPVPKIKIDKEVGAAPLIVQFSAEDSYDYDTQDELSYTWQFDGKTNQEGATAEYTFQNPGVYTPTLTVTDSKGNKSTAQVEIKVGNAKPEVTVAFSGNRSFYYDNMPINYQVKVSDKEDGSTEDGKIDPSQVTLTFDYLKEGKDLALLGSNATVTQHVKGKMLMEGSDCKSCHSMDKASVGPSYLQVAERYHKDPKAVDYLAMKIIQGGNGNWGHSLMAAHPQHSKEETSEMVRYILSLAEEGARQPLQGTWNLKQHVGNGENGSYIINASYTDKGANGMPAITGRETLILRHPRVQAEEYDRFYQVEQQRPNGGALAYVSNIRDGSWIAFNKIDLAGISTIQFNVVSGTEGGQIEVRLDSPEGKRVGTANVPVTGTGRDMKFATTHAAIEATKGMHNLYIVFRHPEVKDKPWMALDWLYFQHQGGKPM